MASYSSQVSYAQPRDDFSQQAPEVMQVAELQRKAIAEARAAREERLRLKAEAEAAEKAAAVDAEAAAVAAAAEAEAAAAAAAAGAKVAAAAAAAATTDAVFTAMSAAGAEVVADPKRKMVAAARAQKMEALADDGKERAAASAKLQAINRGRASRRVTGQMDDKYRALAKQKSMTSVAMETEALPELPPEILDRLEALFRSA